jgi:hypothetical protein
MCRVKPEWEGIIRYQKTTRVHEARAEHEPDFGNALAHGLFTQAKNQCKNQEWGGGSKLFMKCSMKSECPLMGQRKYYML